MNAMSRGPAYSPEVGGVSLELHCVACRLQGSSKTRLDRVAWRPGLRVPMLGPSLIYEEGPEGQAEVKARAGRAIALRNGGDRFRGSSPR